MQRYKQPHMDVHPDGEWIRYADHCEAMKRIAGEGAEPVAFSERASVWKVQNPETGYVWFTEAREQALHEARTGKTVTGFGNAIAAPSASAQQAEPDGIACSSCGLTMQQSRWLAAAPAPTQGTQEPKCKPGGCSAIGCEGGIYCFESDGTPRKEPDPAEVAAALSHILAAPAPSASPAALTDATRLPERVIDTLISEAGVSTFHPDGDQLGKLHEFAQGVANEVLARIPRALLAASPADQGEDARDE